MVNVKILIAGLTLSLLVVALAASDARVAGDSRVLPQNDGEKQEANLSEALESTLDISVNENAEEGNQEEKNVSASFNMDRSSSVDVDFDSNVDISVSGEGRASVETPSKTSKVNVNGQTITCEPGQDYVSADRSVECENDGEDVDFEVNKRSDSGGSINIKFDVNQSNQE